MRVLIACFLLVLFSTQAFPLTVWNNTITQTQSAVATANSAEEEEKGSVTPKEGKAKKQNTLSEEDYDHVHHSHGRPSNTAQNDEQVLSRAESLYPLFKREVTTPPPNCC